MHLTVIGTNAGGALPQDAPMTIDHRSASSSLQQLLATHTAAELLAKLEPKRTPLAPRIPSGGIDPDAIANRWAALGGHETSRTGAARRRDARHRVDLRPQHRELHRHGEGAGRPGGPAARQRPVRPGRLLRPARHDRGGAGRLLQPRRAAHHRGGRLHGRRCSTRASAARPASPSRPRARRAVRRLGDRRARRACAAWPRRPRATAS